MHRIKGLARIRRGNHCRQEFATSAYSDEGCRWPEDRCLSDDRESAPEAIVVHTPEKFLFLNTFVADRLSSRSASLVGRPIMEFVHPDWVPLIVEHIRKLLTTGDVNEALEVRLVTEDGTVVPAEITFGSRRFRGAVRLLGLIRDSSRRVWNTRVAKPRARSGRPESNTIARRNSLLD